MKQEIGLADKGHIINCHSFMRMNSFIFWWCICFGCIPNLLLAYSSNYQDQSLADSTLEKLFSQIAAIPDSSRLDTLLLYAQLYGENNFERSLKVAKWGVQQAQEAGQNEYIAKFNSEMAASFSSLAQYDSSLVYYDKVIDYAKQYGHLPMLANALKWKGLVKVNQGFFLESFALYMKSLKIYETLEDGHGIAKLNNKICDVLYFMERYDEGIMHGKRAEKILEKIDDGYLLFNTYQLIGDNYMGINEYDKALDYIDKSMVLAIKLEVSPISMASLYNARGNALKLMARYDESVAEYRLSNDIVHELNHPGGMSATLANLSDVYMRQGDYESALPYQLASYELMKKHGINMNRMELIDNLSTIYKNLNQFEKALLYREQHQNIRDSTMSLEKDEITKELSAKYETEKKEELISLQQDKLSRQRLLQILGLNFLAALTGMLLLLYRNYKLKQKTNAKLSLANNQLEIKNKENELLLKEIHHRVKNNLQTVSSLLSLQSRSISDKTALDAVQESKNRVASMAMIHQKLYQRDNLAAIEMRDYFETIGKAIINSFGEKAKNVDLDIQMNEFELDVDTAVPIGLIANELITNSLKHAFPNNEGGMVSITLSEEDNLIKLTIADNGKGVPQPSSESIKRGFGTQLVQLLTAQLDGKIDRSTTDGTSTVILFSLPDKSIA